MIKNCEFRLQLGNPDRIAYSADQLREILRNAEGISVAQQQVLRDVARVLDQMDLQVNGSGR